MGVCGIFGCMGKGAAKMVLDGLSRLEYRGYDSAGLAAHSPGDVGPVDTERTTGYVSELVSRAGSRFDEATIAIGHTRWATHGKVNQRNAHPHSSEDGRITIVHNGIIENSNELLERVRKLGYNLRSETDTELFVHLMDHELKTQPSNMTAMEAFVSTIGLIRGSWAIAIILSGYDGILVSRNGAPIVIGRGNDGIFVSSDIQALEGFCSEVAYLNDGDNMKITKSGIEGLEGTQWPEFEKLQLKERGSHELGSFSHFMLKEIHDQPLSLSNVISGRISADDAKVMLGGFEVSAEEMMQMERINLVGCGSAYYASQIGSRVIRKWSGIAVEAFESSEFEARRLATQNSLTIGVTQSGETKDTLSALQDARNNGGKVASICNVKESTIARFTSNGAYLHAGPEYSVASTKVFTNMVAALSLLGLSISDIGKEEFVRIASELRKLPNKIAIQLMEKDGSIELASEILLGNDSALFIGRGISSPLAKEGALKLIEEAYIPSISYSGGELKHGPLALIENGTPVVAIAPSDSTFQMMEYSIAECVSRGARIILITDNEGPILEQAEVVIQTQVTHEDLSPLVSVIPLQLLAYQTALKKGLSIDRPRNLAKSVTVH